MAPVSKKLQESLGLPLLNDLFATGEEDSLYGTNEPTSKTSNKKMSIPDFEDILREAERDDDIDDDEIDEDSDYFDPDVNEETIRTNKISNKIVESSMPPLPPSLPQIILSDDNQKDHENEMDVFSKKVESKADDLIELAYSVDPKAAGSILAAATKMLQLSLDAKKNKRSTQLDMAKIQLEAIRIEKMAAAPTQQQGNIPVGDIPPNARIVSREDLMKRIKKD